MSSRQHSSPTFTATTTLKSSTLNNPSSTITIIDNNNNDNHNNINHNTDHNNKSDNNLIPIAMKLTGIAWIDGILSQRDKLIWCSFWFLSNLLITFYNKHILSHLDVSPLINTFSHMLLTFIGCLIVQQGIFPNLTKNDFFRLIIYSFIFALNIIWSQFGMKLTTLSLNQVCRAMTPMFQVGLTYFLIHQKQSYYTLIPLIPVCIGVAITSNAEINLTFLALVISISSVFISALKGVLSMKILQNDLNLKLQEYTFLLVVSPFSMLWIIIFEFISNQYLNDNGNNNQSFLSFFSLFNNYNSNDDNNNSIPWIYLLIGGFMAFLVNVASIGTVKRTSATSMGVMANAKQAITIFGAMFFTENGNWSMMKFVGITITLFGAILYSYRKETERQKKNSNSINS